MAIINVTSNSSLANPIQNGIDKAQKGDLILVESGIYNEELIITKDNIRILAKGNSVIIDGGGIKDIALELRNVKDVEIKGFIIRNFQRDGIVIKGGEDNQILDNKISNIVDCGILISNSNNNLIWTNEIMKCRVGIRLGEFDGGNGNYIIENILIENVLDGILLSLVSISNTSIVSNKIIDNSLNGIVDIGKNTTIINNKIYGNGKTGISSIFNSKILNNDIYDNKEEGVCVSEGTFSSLNKICNNKIGIILCSNFNKVYKNKIYGNKNRDIIGDLSNNVVEENEM